MIIDSGMQATRTWLLVGASHQAGLRDNMVIDHILSYFQL